MSKTDWKTGGRASRLSSAAFVAVAAAAWIGFGVVAFQMPDFGLDPSWRAVLGEGLRLKLGFGTEIIYTGGPLSAVYTRYFMDSGFWPLMAIEFLLVASFAGLVTTLCGASRRPTLIVAWIVALLSIGDVRDPLLMVLPLLTALAALDRKPGAGLAIAMGVTATAVVTLAKFSVFPLAIASFLLVDAEGLSRRRLPVHAAAYAAATFVLFGVLQAPGAFWPFVIGSLDVSSGYTEAMFIIGPAAEPLWFLVAMAALLVAAAAAEVRAVRDRASRPVPSAVRLGLGAAYLFMVWKAGFVRPDLHTLIAWAGLGLAALAYAAARPATARPAVTSILLPLGAAAALLLVIPSIWAGYAHESGLAYIERLLQGIRTSAVDTAELVANPAGRVAAWQAGKDAAWAKIRSTQPLPRLVGSVDVIPSIQSSVLAHGLDYRPHRGLQEYIMYTSRLIEAEREGLVAHGPTYLLFQPGSIDGRHPATAEGAMWPEIMRYYEADSQQGDLLVLRRRAEPLGQILTDPRTLHARFDQDVALPASPNPVFLKATIRKTLFGRLMDLVYRPSLIVMRVTYLDGSEQRYRVVPAIAQAGFFVSPLIAHADDFLMLSTGAEPLPLPKVGSIAFETSPMGKRMFEPDIAIDLQSHDMQALRQAPPTAPTMRQLIEDRQRLALLKSAAQGSSRVRLIPEGVLAEAPTAITVPVDQASRHLTVSYGVSAGAYAKPEGTHGVCFRVLQQRADGASLSLLDRCLSPLDHAQDRGEVTSEVAADLRPGDRLSFDTTCLTTCAYGWAYWSRFSLDP